MTADRIHTAMTPIFSATGAPPTGQNLSKAQVTEILNSLSPKNRVSMELKLSNVPVSAKLYSIGRYQIKNASDVANFPGMAKDREFVRFALPRSKKYYCPRRQRYSPTDGLALSNGAA